MERTSPTGVWPVDPWQPCGRRGRRVDSAIVTHESSQDKSRPGRAPIRLVAIDIDGTLLRTDKRLSTRCARAIQKASDAGVRVVLASARPPRTLREIYGHLGLDTLTINYNGALIHDHRRRKHVYHQPLDVDLARKVVKAARKIDPSTVVSVEILDKWYTDHVDETLPTETSVRFMPDFVGPLEAFLRVPVTKLMLLAPPQRMTAIATEVRSRFVGRVAVAVSDPHLLQVVHPKVDKGHALAMIAEQYGVKQEEAMAIGDAPNDVGMLKWAGLGVAVQNAWDKAREAADVVVPSNDEDGVAHAIERFVL